MSKSRIVRVWIAVACLSLVISACSSSPKKQGKEEPKNTEIKSFQAPEIPPVYTDQRERAKYLVTHYWDKFNFADTSLIRMPEITELLAGVALCLVYRCRERDFRDVG